MDQALGLFLLVSQQQSRQFARGTARQTDDPFVVGGEQLFIDTRTVVVAFEVGCRRHLDEVLKPLAIHRQQGQMVRRILHARGCAVGAMTGSDVGLIAEDRVHARVFGLLVELQSPIEIAVVGDRTRVHPELFDLLDQVGNLAGTVEQRIVRMAVQVGERTCFTHDLLPVPRAGSSGPEKVRGAMSGYCPRSPTETQAGGKRFMVDCL